MLKIIITDHQLLKNKDWFNKFTYFLARLVGICLLLVHLRCNMRLKTLLIFGRCFKLFWAFKRVNNHCHHYITNTRSLMLPFSGWQMAILCRSSLAVTTQDLISTALKAEREYSPAVSTCTALNNRRFMLWRNRICIHCLWLKLPYSDQM